MALTIDTVKNGDKTLGLMDNKTMSPYLQCIFELTDTSYPSDGVVTALLEYYDGSDWISVTTLKKTVITVNGSQLYRFDFSNVLQTIVGKDIVDEGGSSALVTSGSAFMNEFRITFTLSYTNNVGDWVSDAPVTTGNSYYVSNAIIQPDAASQNMDNYVMLDNSTTKFLTNIPQNQDIHIDEEYQLSFITANGVQTYEVRYEGFDSSGISLGVNNVGASTVPNLYGIAVINSTTILTTSMATIDVWIYNVSEAAQASEKITFTVNQNPCTDSTRVVWLNELGGVDRFTFKGYKREIESVKRSNYRKYLSVDYTRNDRGNSTYGSVNSNNIILASQSITEDVSRWLHEMLRSTDVSVYVSSGVRLPIIVNNESTTMFDTNSVNQFVLDYEYARRDMSHVG
jgi:hypothetical protein